MKKSLKRLSASLAALLIGCSTCPNSGARQLENVETVNVNEKKTIPNGLLHEFSRKIITELFNLGENNIRKPKLKPRYDLVIYQFLYQIKCEVEPCYVEFFRDFRVSPRSYALSLLNSESIFKFFDIYVNKILIPVCECPRTSLSMRKFIEEESLKTIAERSIELISHIPEFFTSSEYLNIHNSLINILRGLKVYFESNPQVDPKLKQEITSKIRKTKIYSCF